MIGFTAVTPVPGMDGDFSRNDSLWNEHVVEMQRQWISDIFGSMFSMNVDPKGKEDNLVMAKADSK